MKIKICGLTRVEDAVFAAESGADFLGMIFVRESPRCLDVERATEISGAVRGKAKLVGVFRDAPTENVREIAERVGLDFVQLHGDESDDDIVAIGVPAIKALNFLDVAQSSSAERAEDRRATFPHAEWMLFDSGGGSGRTFDWSLIKNYDRTKPFLLAGGITPDNVAAAISFVRPDAIDVASGVESSPGVKDHWKIARLIERVRRA
jgi:phosphoribosylanthranilate isomerase